MPVTVSATETKFSDLTRMPDARGHFGPYGGRFVSETLSFALEELEQIYLSLRDDPIHQRGWIYIQKTHEVHEYQAD